jgi:hypothetical protein
MGIHPPHKDKQETTRANPTNEKVSNPQEPIGTNKRKKTSRDQFCQNYYILSSSTRYHIAYNSVDHF